MTVFEEEQELTNDLVRVIQSEQIRSSILNQLKYQDFKGDSKFRATSKEDVSFTTLSK